ncbi:MAG: shikimate dehydrogenase [Bacteroidota bacterium]
MRQFGLLGKSLGHSFSRKYFTQKFQDEGIESEYHLHELTDISELPALLKQYPNIRGLNVTIPYKTAVLPYMDDLSDEARSVGAVNTIRVEQDRLTGHNSDVVGFKRSLEEFLADAVPAQALILGTGGAAKAVEYVLLHYMKIPFRFVSRTPAQDQFGYDELTNIDMNDWPLIINTTPLGMYPNTDHAPTLPYAKLEQRHFVYDLIYNPAETKLMTLAKAQGVSVCNGLQMLILQAERSWEIWNEIDESGEETV